MATAAQLRKISKPILNQHPDLVLHGRWLFRPPIARALIGLFIDRSFAADLCRMHLVIRPLSRLVHPSNFGYAMDFDIEDIIGAPPWPEEKWKAWVEAGRPPPPPVHTNVFDPDFPDHLLRNFNAKGRKFLDQQFDWPQLIARVRPYCIQPLRIEFPEVNEGWAAAVTGDFIQAEALLTEYMKLMPTRAVAAGLLAELKTRNPTAIAAYLHQLEANFINDNKLDRFWQRTPFPFEVSL
ncbi:MAG: hypothetical protein INF88_14390 [Roseomonas sp.]|nr:hypothetical protein [Roseomonas sp.]